MHTDIFDTVEGGKFTVHHNGDYSGDVKINIPVVGLQDERVTFQDMSEQRERFGKLIHAPEDLMKDFYEVSIPYQLLEQIVADKLRDDLMSKIEEMTTSEILGLAMRQMMVK